MSRNELAPVHMGLVNHLLEVDGHTATELRRAAFANTAINEPVLRTLIEKVALRPTTITDQDLVAANSAGFTDDQVFEIVICAAVGQASRQYEKALAALAEAEVGGS